MQTRETLLALHGLRGVVAVWVMVHHVSRTVPVANFGYLGVDVFFMLSGFVLFYAHADDFRVLTGPLLARFFAKRAFRTLPLHLICLVPALVLFVVIHRRLPSPEAALASTFLLDIWAIEGLGTNVPIWSLGVEWIGYAVFPFIVYALLRLGRLAAIPSAMIVVAPLLGELLLFQAMGVDRLIRAIFYPEAVIRMIAGFAAGVALAWWMAARPAIGGRIADALLTVSIAGTGIILTTSSTDALTHPFLLLAVCSLAAPGHVGRLLFENRVALFLGRISFPLYLVHFMTMLAVSNFAAAFVPAVPGAFVSVAVYGLSIIAAVALSAWIEAPARRIGYRWIDRRLPSPAAESLAD